MTTSATDLERLILDILDTLRPDQRSEIYDRAQRTADSCRYFADLIDDEAQRTYFRERADLWQRIADRRHQAPT